MDSLTHEAVALIAEEFFTDEAEVLEIGFLPKFLLFTYVRFDEYSLRLLPLHRLCAFRGVHFRHLSTGVPVCFKEYIVGILFSVPLRSYTLAR